MTGVAAAGDTEIRILGPVELWRAGGSRCTSEGGGSSALLVLLALRANEVVSSDRLVDALFGADAPDTSMNALQAAVSRLRRLLEPGALETRGGGYVLHVDADQLDGVALRAPARRRARAARAAATRQRAASTLREALSLWRGARSPTAPRSTSPSRDHAGWTNCTWTALRDRIDAELELGRQQELVPELEELVAENPMQERPRGQLMLALYRCGRQAEALDDYRRDPRAA